MAQPGSNQKWPSLHKWSEGFKAIHEMKKAPAGFSIVHLSADEAVNMNTYILGGDDIIMDTSTTVENGITGIQYHGEYLRFPQTGHATADKEKRSVFISPVVTNANYNVFRDYVRDSIMRRLLIESSKHPEDYAIKTYNDELEINKPRDWHINWDAKYSYSLPPIGSDDPNASKYGQSHLIADFFYPEHERFYRRRQIDQRKLYYSFYWLDFHAATRSAPKQTESKKDQNGTIRGHFDRSKFIISEFVPLLRDTAIWYHTDLPINYKQWLTENYTTHPSYKDAPVIGLTGYQAWAYVKWQEENIIKHYSSLSMGYRTGLPRKIEADKKPLPQQFIEVPEVNNSWWTITNQDYITFLKAVQDSIMRSSGPDFFPDHAVLPTYNWEGKEKDLYEGYINYKYGIKNFTKSKNKEVQSHFNNLIHNPNADHWTESGLIHPKKIVFTYSWIDFERTIEMGTYTLSHWYEGETKKTYNIKDVDQWYEPIGKDLSLSSHNQFGNDAGVRSHENRSRFIIVNDIHLYPGIDCINNKLYCDADDIVCSGCPDFDKLASNQPIEFYDFQACPSCPIKNITWEQAKAYYHWYTQKRAGHKKLTKTNPTGNMLPTEEQWKMASNGNSIIIPKTKVSIPKPVFRYTIE